jgi:hypothetical protein
MSQGLRLAHASTFIAVSAAVVAPIAFNAAGAYDTAGDDGPDPGADRIGVLWSLAELVRRRRALAEQLRRSGRAVTEESLRIALFAWLPEMMLDPEHGAAVTHWLCDLVLGLPDGALGTIMPATTIAEARDAIAEARLWSGTPMPIVDRLGSAPARPAAPTSPFPPAPADPDAHVPWSTVPRRAAPRPPAPAPAVSPAPLVAPLVAPVPLVAPAPAPTPAPDSAPADSLVLPAGLSAALERAAAADGRSVHATIVAALEQYIAGRERSDGQGRPPTEPAAAR